MSLRVALFASHYYGLSLLQNTLSLKERYPEIEIVGVASDDPHQSYVSPQKRLWQYPHTEKEEEMVAAIAKKNGIPVWRERVKTRKFHNVFSSWMPDVCYMSVFGQRIPETIWSRPLYGFYNFHSCGGEVWPSNTGAQAFESMSRDSAARGAVAMHAVDNELDHGPLVAFSRFFNFSADEGVLQTFKRTSPLVGELMTWHLEEILGANTKDVTSPRVINEEQMEPVWGPAIRRNNRNVA